MLDGKKILIIYSFVDTEGIIQKEPHKQKSWIHPWD